MKCPGETLKYEIFRERLFGNSNLLIWPLISFDSEIDIKKLELFKTENLVADSYFQLSRGNAEMWKLLIKCFLQSLALPTWKIILFYLNKNHFSKLRFLILEKYLGIILPFRCPGETLKCEIFRERFFKKLKLAHLTFDKNWFPNRYFRNRIIYTKKFRG